MTTPPFYGRCDLPGHEHPVYREVPSSRARYRVSVWMSWADVEADQPRAVTYHDDAISARNQYDGWRDAPIAEMIELTR